MLAALAATKISFLVAQGLVQTLLFVMESLNKMCPAIQDSWSDADSPKLHP